MSAPGKINLSQPIADFLNQAIINNAPMVLQIDANSLNHTPPAIMVAAVGNHAELLRRFLRENGIKDTANLILRPE